MTSLFKPAEYFARSKWEIISSVTVFSWFIISWNWIILTNSRQRYPGSVLYWQRKGLSCLNARGISASSLKRAIGSKPLGFFLNWTLANYRAEGSGATSVVHWTIGICSNDFMALQSLKQVFDWNRLNCLEGIGSRGSWDKLSVFRIQMMNIVNFWKSIQRGFYSSLLSFHLESNLLAGNFKQNGG